MVSRTESAMAEPAMAEPACEVAARARACLQSSPYATVRQVDCRFDAGTLFLHGCLPAWYHKQLAQEAVARVDGVRQVVNRIEVVFAS